MHSNVYSRHMYSFPCTVLCLSCREFLGTTLLLLHLLIFRPFCAQVAISLLVWPHTYCSPAYWCILVSCEGEYARKYGCAHLKHFPQGGDYYGCSVFACCRSLQALRLWIKVILSICSPRAARCLPGFFFVVRWYHEYDNRKFSYQLTFMSLRKSINVFFPLRGNHSIGEQSSCRVRVGCNVSCSWLAEFGSRLPQEYASHCSQICHYFNS